MKMTSTIGIWPGGGLARNTAALVSLAKGTPAREQELPPALRPLSHELVDQLLHEILQQRKTGRPVRLEPAEVTRQAVDSLVDDVAPHGYAVDRATVRQQKVPHPDSCTAARRAPSFVFAQRNSRSQFEVSPVCSDAHAIEEICSPLSISQSPGSSRRNWTPEGANARSTLPPNS